MAPKRPRHAASTLALVVLLLGSVLLWEPAGATSPATSRVATLGGLSATAFMPSSLRARCPSSVRRQFRPYYINATGVRRPVVAPRRVNGSPGTPAISTTGKRQWAWDRWFVWPGAKRGNVLLNAHTWPDGTALGNRLLARLQIGMRIVVKGASGQILCYRVTRRFEVPGTMRVPSYYSAKGSPQLAIAVCSGRRLGPEHWEKRTIWYARPSS